MIDAVVRRSPALTNRPVEPSPAVSASPGTQGEESGKMLGIGGLLISIRAARTKMLQEGAFPNDEHSGYQRSDNDGVSGPRRDERLS